MAFKVGEAEDEVSSGRSVKTIMIAGRIATAIDMQAAEQLVTDVRIGLGYTAVELAGDRAQGSPARRLRRRRHATVQTVCP